MHTAEGNELFFRSFRGYCGATARVTEGRSAPNCSSSDGDAARRLKKLIRLRFGPVAADLPRKSRFLTVDRTAEQPRRQLEYFMCK